MPSFRKPKGVRSISTTDWFYANGGAGSGAVANVAGKDSQVSLYNNDQARWLFVYNIVTGSAFANIALYWATQGQPTTALLGTCFPVVCDGGLPPGQIFGGNVPQITLGTVTFPLVQLFANNGGQNGGGPLAVIKPGYALNVQSAGDIECSFGFIAMGP